MTLNQLLCYDSSSSSWLHVLPAVHNNGSRIGWIDSLDLLEEFQHADGWERHPEIWPASEVELGDQPRSSGTIAALLWSSNPLMKNVQTDPPTHDFHREEKNPQINENVWKTYTITCHFAACDGILNMCTGLPVPGSRSARTLSQEIVILLKTWLFRVQRAECESARSVRLVPQRRSTVSTESERISALLRLQMEKKKGNKVNFAIWRLLEMAPYSAVEKKHRMRSYRCCVKPSRWDIRTVFSLLLNTPTYW